MPSRAVPTATNTVRTSPMETPPIENTGCTSVACGTLSRRPGHCTKTRAARGRSARRNLDGVLTRANDSTSTSRAPRSRAQRQKKATSRLPKETTRAGRSLAASAAESTAFRNQLARVRTAGTVRISSGSYASRMLAEVTTQFGPPISLRSLIACPKWPPWEPAKTRYHLLKRATTPLSQSLRTGGIESSQCG